MNSLPYPAWFSHFEFGCYFHDEVGCGGARIRGNRVAWEEEKEGAAVLRPYQKSAALGAK
jgi:hypothetical protein